MSMILAIAGDMWLNLSRLLHSQVSSGESWLAEKELSRPKIAAALEKKLFLAGYYKALGLGSGPCELCETCAFDEGCRHPYKARPSMEACGIDVFATVRSHSFTIDVVRTRKAPQHYFGLVLVE